MTEIIKTTTTENLTEEKKKMYKLMSENYYSEAKRLEIHISSLKKKLDEKPAPEVADLLEKSVKLYREEVREILSNALKLARYVSPPPQHPSLLRRERDAS
jgi:predicted patatin/cPLA2 family phospholipase